MDMLWNGWGNPARATPLPDTVSGLLRDLLGVAPRGAAALPLEEIGVPASPLDATVRRALERAVGDRPDRVRTDAETRLRHTRGKSTPDLLRMRAGDTADTPAAVVLPDDHDQVLAVLAACVRHRLALVPFGGGTSVVGGLAPEGGSATAGFVALDLRHMNRLLDLDEVSRTATLQPGLRAPKRRRCSPNGATPSATSPSPTSGPPSAASPPPAPAVRPRPATAASTRWSSASPSPPPRAPSTPAAPRAPPPDPTCASSSWAPRAPSASSRRSPCACAPCRGSAATRAGASPPSTPAPPPCAASPRTDRARRCCGCRTRRRR